MLWWNLIALLKKGRTALILATNVWQSEQACEDITLELSKRQSLLKMEGITSWLFFCKPAFHLSVCTFLSRSIGYETQKTEQYEAKANAQNLHPKTINISRRAKQKFGSSSTRRFWVTDGNRKWGVFLLILSVHIYIAKYLFTSADD